MTDASTVLALDVGGQRIGVAVASLMTRLPQTLPTLQHSEHAISDIADLVENHQATALVVGLPRGVEGQETAQTKVIRDFAAQLKQAVTVPVHFQDEALTSKQAEAELHARRVPYNKGDVDALAALYILEDYLRSHDQKGAI